MPGAQFDNCFVGEKNLLYIYVIYIYMLYIYMGLYGLYMGYIWVIYIWNLPTYIWNIYIYMEYPEFFFMDYPHWILDKIWPRKPVSDWISRRQKWGCFMGKFREEWGCLNRVMGIGCSWNISWVIFGICIMC